MYEKWLRSFHYVAKNGGFTLAANELGLSQPTVTQQVRALEAHFAVELFHRAGRRVALTPFGERLFQITHDIFAMTDEAVSYLGAVRDLKAGQMAIGTVGPAATMPLVERFARRFPNVSLSVDIGPAEHIVQGLDDYGLDVVVLATRLDGPQYHSIPMGGFEVGVFVHRDHPWSRRARVHVKELDGERVVLREASSSTQQVIDRAVARHKLRFSHVVRVTGREGVREAVLRNIGVGIVCAVDYVPSESLHFLPIEGADDLEIRFFLTCLARRRNRPLIRGFFELADGPRAGSPAPRGRAGAARRSARPTRRRS